MFRAGATSRQADAALTEAASAGRRTGNRRLRAVVIGCVLLATGCLAPASARADGGQSIASAPAVAFGQQQFGNTANGLRTDDGVANVWQQYWTLAVTAGDIITIDWKSQTLPTLSVYSAGITDFSIGNIDPVESQGIGGNGHSQLRFTAPSSGVMPLVITNSWQGPGPYDFTAYVQHAVRLSIPRLSKLRRKATLAVSARNAEGGVISNPALQVDVQIKRRKAWRKVGTAPVTDSVAAVKLNVPAGYAGQKVSLRAVAHGNGYINAASRSLQVRVAGKTKRG